MGLRFFIELSFKGTAYHGWQIQKNALSVQQVLNNALSTIFRHSIETIGCGRTDTGVHASQFFAHFDTFCQFDPVKTRISLNSMLPGDIAIIQFYAVELNSHARFDAILRKYSYRLYFQKNPFLKGQSCYLPYVPDIEPMNKACSLLMEHTDFTCFSKTHTQVKTNLCQIFSAQWYWHENELIFEISADRFLRNMVRAIVGTMLQAGRNELSAPSFVEIIESKNRSMAGVSVPAEGLYLCTIDYPYKLINL